jgi:hypothetical protein
MSKSASVFEVAESAAIPADRAMEASIRLSKRGLINFQTNVGTESQMMMTEEGLDEAERLRNARGGPRLSEIDLRRNLEVVLVIIDRLRPELERLDAREQADVAADVETVQAQARADQPNRPALRAALSRLQRMWPGFASAVQTAASALALIRGL